MSEVKQYRKKPVVIEAMRLGSNFTPDKEAVVQFAAPHAHIDAKYGYLFISTLEGEMRVSAGDYVIKGVNGEFYPCKPDIFHKSYDAVTA